MTGRYVIMGVSGCGKSVIGAALANRMGATFVDGDDLHPRANVEKMARGQPLDDTDRAPWLGSVGAALDGTPAPVIIGCSALKRGYRDMIRAKAGAVTFIHLVGDRALISARLDDRRGHFMPPALLDSQFAALEPPAPPETFIAVSIDQSPQALVDDIMGRIARLPV